MHKEKKNNEEFKVYYEEKGDKTIEEIVYTLMAIYVSSFILLFLLLILLQEMKILE